MNLSQHTLLIIARGFAKTTIAGVAIPLYNTLFQEVKFTLYVSNAEDHAAMQLENARRELESNPLILQVFGNLRPRRTDSEKWSSRFYETTTGVAAAARGSGGQVRGLNHMGTRPQRVIVDDLEDRDSVSSDTLRAKTKTWFMSDLKPVLPKLDPSASITVLGTILHSDCLLENLARDPQWTTVRMGVTDREGDLLWPENMDARKIEAEKQSYASMGQLSTFYMEYHSMIIAPEAQIFRQEKFQYGTPKGRILAMSIAMDPAISKQRTADDTAIAGCALTEFGQVIVLDMWGKRGAEEQEKMDEYFDMIKRWNMIEFNLRAGIEAIAFQATLLNTVREQMFRRGIYFEAHAITHKTNKVSRIKNEIQPRLNSGHLWFSHRFPKLEEQLLMFREDGSHMHDDWPDALAMAIGLLGEFAAFSAPGPVFGDSLPDIEEAIGGPIEWAH
jgi:predicted phage terminase large subunit-like protein